MSDNITDRAATYGATVVRSMKARRRSTYAAAVESATTRSATDSTPASWATAGIVIAGPPTSRSHSAAPGSRQPREMRARHPAAASPASSPHRVRRRNPATAMATPATGRAAAPSASRSGPPPTSSSENRPINRGAESRISR